MASLAHRQLLADIRVAEAIYRQSVCNDKHQKLVAAMEAAQLRYTTAMYLSNFSTIIAAVPPSKSCSMLNRSGQLGWQ